MSHKQSGSQVKNQSRLSWLLDESIALPGGYKIGLDGILGLIPGIGDIVGSGLSTFIVYKGYKRGVPKVILFRMMINIVIDTLVGAIPIVGDVFDFVWKANAMNSKLLDSYQQQPEKTASHSAEITALFVFIVALISLGCITAIYLLFTFLFSLI